MTETASRNEPFPDPLIDQIAEAIGCEDAAKRALLASELRHLPQDVALWKTRNLVSAPSEMDRNLAPIGKAADNLLRSIGIDEKDIENAKPIPDRTELNLLLWQLAAMFDDERPEALLQSGEVEGRFQSHLLGVVALRNASAAARASLQKSTRSGRGGPRHEADWALQETAWHLLRLYRRVTGRAPGASVDPNTNTVGGPAVRFLGLALPPLGWTLSPKAIRKLIRKVKEENPKDPP